jgi:hypothetical protein
MSAKIEQIVEVIEEIREQRVLNQSRHSITSVRQRAIASISARRQIELQSVNDKFIRKLRPEIKYLRQFDELLERWLVHGSDDLQRILVKHASTQSDRRLVENAFYIPPEPDVPLAQEFGFDPNEAVFREGKEQLKLHLVKERNRHLVDLAKHLWNKRAIGNISCGVCGFSFQQVYGSIGVGFIEVHHKIPISSLAPDTAVKIADLLPVCSNCHRMLHRHKPWLTTDQLHDAIEAQKK